MTMTVKIFLNGDLAPRTVAATSPIQTKPSDRVQVVIDGVVVDPDELELDVAPSNLVVEFLDGRQITLLNFVDLNGGAGGGLVGADPDQVVRASTIEGLTAPAAGESAGPDTAGEANLSNFNRATISEFAEFGSGGGGKGQDLDDWLAILLDDPEAFELILAALEVPVIETPPAVEPIVIPEVVPVEEPATPPVAATVVIEADPLPPRSSLSFRRRLSWGHPRPSRTRRRSTRTRFCFSP